VVTRSPIRAIRVLACVAALAGGCTKIPPDPLTLKGNLLTIDNRTKQEWSNVEVWLNWHYRITAKSIPPGGRLQAPLDMFVAGLGQRFDARRTQIRDLRLTAKLPDGQPIELKKAFEGDGLKGALGGIGKKR
jgi:hypothetical protein